MDCGDILVGLHSKGCLRVKTLRLCFRVQIRVRVRATAGINIRHVVVMVKISQCNPLLVANPSLCVFVCQTHAHSYRSGRGS